MLEDGIAIIILALVWLLVVAAGYVWYAWALSQLFKRLGTDGWRGWVPVMNEMTILERGGVPAWNVVFYFFPIVNLYGLYLKFVATQRIGQHFGRGTGMAVLAVLFTPLWATILVLQRQPAGHAPQQQAPPPVAHRQVAGGMASGEQSPPTGAPQPGQPGQPGPYGQPAPAALAQGHPASGAPEPSHARATSAHTPPPPTSAPQPGHPPPPDLAAPQPGLPQAAQPAPDAQQPPLAGQSSPHPQAPGTPAPDTPAPSTPAPVSPDQAASETTSPPPPAEPMPEPAPPETPAAPDSEPILVHNPWARPVTAAPIAGEPSKAAMTTPPPSSEGPAWLEPSASASAAGAGASPDLLDDEDDGETVVVDRRPKVQWHLNVDGTDPLPLAGDKVLLGRRPTATVPGTHPLAVPDTTRTLSKAHAQLELVDGEWSITDLHSTNGVLIVDDSGEESLIEPGHAVPVPGRFILGKVGMHISFEQGGA